MQADDDVFANSGSDGEEERARALMAMSRAQAQQTFDELAERRDPEDEDLLLALFILKGVDPKRCIDSYLRNTESRIDDQFFYRADKDVLSRLLLKKTRENSYRIHMLLPWFERPEADRYLFATRNSRELDSHNLIDQNLLEAGAELSQWGKRRNLYHHECRPIVRTGGAPGPLQIAKPLPDRCPCGCRMLDMLVLKAHAPQAQFLGREGILRVRMCLSCLLTNYSELYFRVDPSGDCEPYEKLDYHPGLTLGEAEIAALAANDLGLAAATASPLYAFASCYIRSMGLSTLGGLPHWIRDAEYLPCPECGERMTFFAQIALVDLLDSENILYFQICNACDIVGVNHQ